MQYVENHHTQPNKMKKFELKHTDQCSTTKNYSCTNWLMFKKPKNLVEQNEKCSTTNIIVVQNDKCSTTKNYSFTKKKEIWMETK